jgi:hypothetical protein
MLPLALQPQAILERTSMRPAIPVIVGLLSLNAAAQHAPPAEVLAIHDYVADVSAERIGSDIQTLVDFGTRHTLSETESDTRGIGAARRWIAAEFERISADCGGCLGSHDDRRYD